MTAAFRRHCEAWKIAGLAAVPAAALVMELLLTPVPTLAAAAPADLDAVMSLLAQRQHAEADFTEEKYLSMLKAPARSTGRLIFDAPDHLEERTVTPRPQSVVLDHGMLTMLAGSHSRSVALADYPQFAPLIDSIRATLAGDRAALERAFEVRFEGDTDHWRLHLKPLDPRLRSNLAQIDLTGARDVVAEVEILQRNGDRSLMHITPRE